MKGNIIFLVTAFVFFQVFLFSACSSKNTPPAQENLPGGGVYDGIAVMDYFRQISGKKTILAMHNDEPNSRPAKDTEKIKNITGKYPAMWSGDFLYSAQDVNNRWTMIRECKDQWESGSIVQLMLHVVSPKNEAGETGAGWNAEDRQGTNFVGGNKGSGPLLSDAEWTDLITEGGLLNTRWKLRLDEYAKYFEYLKENKVTVLFRPFHEMNQGFFWWGGRPGQNGTAALFRLTHDYFEKEKGFDNIIWVWNMQDIGNINNFSSVWSSYNPGNEYWDIFSVDVYSETSYPAAMYRAALTVAGNKPIAIGETYVLPTPGKLFEQPLWTFVMGWPRDLMNYNSEDQIRTLYLAENTITKDELPKFGNKAEIYNPEDED